MEAFALGIMSSIAYDWSIRRWVEMNFTFEVLNPSRIPHHKVDTPAGRRLIEISGRLGNADQRFSAWAQELGLNPDDRPTVSEKEELVNELDALALVLYGLSLKQIEHLYSSFHRGWDYKPRLEKVLEYYDQWKDKA